MQAAVGLSAQIVLHKVGTNHFLPTCIILDSFVFNIIAFTTAPLSFILSSCAFQCKAWKYRFD
jgi:hypothetical protein